MSNLRTKCPQCGKVQDIQGATPCVSCSTQLMPQAGTISVYRKGSPIGAAVGFGVYINDQPFGHIAATESVTFTLPYGSYKFHMTCGATRRCKDLVVTLSPEFPATYLRAAMKAGFWSNTILIDPMKPEEFPQK